MSDPNTQNAQAQAEAAEREAMEVLTVAKAIVVTNAEQFQAAGRVFAEIKTKLKDLENQRTAITGPINASLKLVNDLFRRPKESLEAALAFYERPMAAYKREEERLRREAEAAARKEQERLEQEARERAQAEERRLSEIRRQEEEARKAAESATNPVAAFIQQRKADELAQEAEAAFDSTTNALREAATVQAPIAYVPRATAAGVSSRTNWKFRIVDASKIRRELLIPNEQLIGEIARGQKEKAKEDGIEFYDEIKIGGR